MVVLIVGVPDSGKSALAEDLALEMAGDGKRIYVATMQILDDEGKRRVEKHRKLRDGKGFLTVEAPVEVARAVAEVPGIDRATVLLECVSNLVGNVMHDEALMAKASKDDVASCVAEDVAGLCGAAPNVVLVTNSFPRDDDGYDEDTRQYVECLDEVNGKLRRLADVVYEFIEGEWQRSENN